jgi:hypothetical protein
MSSLHKTLAAAALLVAMSPAAHAYEYFTPVSSSQDGTAITCAIVNVGTTPIVVSAAVQQMTDGSDITNTTICPPSPGTLPPGAACFAYTTQVGSHLGYCHFTTSSSKVRGDLIIFGTNGDVMVTIPATR